MKKILHVILISLFSLTIISCAKKSSSSSSDTTDTSTTNTDTTTQMGGSIQGVELSLSTAVTTVAGTGSSGSANGTRTSASFNQPSGITTDGTNLYVADSMNNLIRKIVISTGVVTTVAGTGSSGTADGTGTSASFTRPKGITTDGTNLYVADDDQSGLVRKIVISTGVVTKVSDRGVIREPKKITTDGTNLYVTDKNCIIRKIE